MTKNQKFINDNFQNNSISCKKLDNFGNKQASIFLMKIKLVFKILLILLYI